MTSLEELLDELCEAHNAYRALLARGKDIFKVPAAEMEMVAENWDAVRNRRDKAIAALRDYLHEDAMLDEMVDE